QEEKSLGPPAGLILQARLVPSHPGSPPIASALNRSWNVRNRLRAGFHVTVSVHSWWLGLHYIFIMSVNPCRSYPLDCRYHIFLGLSMPRFHSQWPLIMPIILGASGSVGRIQWKP